MNNMFCKYHKIILLMCGMIFSLHSGFASAQVSNKDSLVKTLKEDSLVKNANQSDLAKDEGIKCTRAELVDKEFVTVGKSKYGELLRITFQDLERGGREIIFQKKLMENDEVKFYMPFDLCKEAKTAVLIVMKGGDMFFKKIDITD